MYKHERYYRRNIERSPDQRHDSLDRVQNGIGHIAHETDKRVLPIGPNPRYYRAYDDKERINLENKNDKVANCHRYGKSGPVSLCVSHQKGMPQRTFLTFSAFRQLVQTRSVRTLP